MNISFVDPRILKYSAYILFMSNKSYIEIWPKELPFMCKIWLPYVDFLEILWVGRRSVNFEENIKLSDKLCFVR